MITNTTSGTIVFIINPTTSGYTGLIENPPRRKPKKSKRRKKLPPKYGRVVVP